MSVISVIPRFGASFSFSFGFGFSVTFDNMYGSTGVGIIGVGFNCYGRSNRGSIGHSRMGKGIRMVGIWGSSNSVVEGGWVVSVVSGVQHSGFGLFFFGFTLYHLIWLFFGRSLPPVSVRVSVAIVSIVPRSGFSIGLCIRGSFGLGISQSNKQKY